MRIHDRIRTCTALAAALALTLVGTMTARADDAPGGPPAGAAPSAPQETPTNPGDPRRIDFVLPFERALARAKAEKRLLFVKPIYGGVDRAGAEDYRCGSW